MQSAFDNNLIQRVDVRNEQTILEFPFKGRGDVGVMGMQTYFYLTRLYPEKSLKINILPNYSQSFSRSIMFGKQGEAVKREIQTWLKSESGQQTWLQIKAKWLQSITH